MSAGLGEDDADHGDDGVLDPGEGPPQAALDRLDAWLASLYRAVPSPEQLQARRLGSALRLVIDRMVATEAPAEELAAGADQVEALAERLGTFRHGGLYRDFLKGPSDRYPPLFFESAPLLGRSSALAPPLTIEVAAGQVIGRARFGSAYEGPPGCVHGGFIAACFDDVLGMTQSLSGEVAMTGTLQVRYLAPTPLHTEVRFVGTLVRIVGRKIMTSGELLVGEVGGEGEAQCSARAEGVFIKVGTALFEQLQAEKGEPEAR